MGQGQLGRSIIAPKLRLALPPSAGRGVYHDDVNDSHTTASVRNFEMYGCVPPG